MPWCIHRHTICSSRDVPTDCHGPPREWGVKSQQQQRGQDAKLVLTSLSLQPQLPEHRVPKEGFLGSFQHPQAAVLHVTLPPLKDLAVPQGPSGAPSVQLHCLPPTLRFPLHPTLQPSGSSGCGPAAHLAPAALHTWHASPALPHSGSLQEMPRTENCYCITAKYGLLYPFYR